MPELVEVEAYRVLAESVLGRRIRSVGAPDDWFLKGGLTADELEEALTGRRFTAARRRGKLLMLDTGRGGPVLGLRFGMTGRLIVDDRPGVDRLIYSSSRTEPRWDRLVVGLAGGGVLRVSDPRRLGGVELDPDESRLGPDAASVGPAELARALAGSATPLKARIMDQSRLAGVGNLIADELLWRAALAPGRPAGSLDRADLRRLHSRLVSTLRDLSARGGSHTGDLMESRVAGGRCPRDGHPLRRDVVGGRTTWWCPAHQR
ncbi:MAG TPA: DNA-formamidopyrimidine glycosylase family protein [Acidimicrobiales bacterium]|nr:DNA-formamidopyrimidine glycosylase family protein [Acidimicrobiales bacterium]